MAIFVDYEIGGEGSDLPVLCGLLAAEYYRQIYAGFVDEFSDFIEIAVFKRHDSGPGQIPIGYQIVQVVDAVAAVKAPGGEEVDYAGFPGNHHLICFHVIQPDCLQCWYMLIIGQVSCLPHADQ